ncbi:MAG: glycosyltransferase [Candidatus Heimdallarchaeota archaeon]
MFIAPLLVFLDTLLYKRSMVIGHYTLTFGWASAFAVNTKKTIFVMGSDILVEPFKNIIKRFVIKFALRRAQHCIIDNLEGYKNLRKLGFKGTSILSPYGVSISQKPAKLINRIIDNKEIILWNRGTFPIYNIQCFLDALTYVNEETKNDWEVIIAGKGSNDPIFTKNIDSLPFKDNISILGYITDNETMKELYEKSTIYVSSSLSDGTSVALLEAMAKGLSIVSSDIINNRFWIKNTVNGFLFNPTSSIELSEILINLINKEISIDCRDKMIDLSFNHVKKYGSIQSFKNKLGKIIKSQ